MNSTTNAIIATKMAKMASGAVQTKFSMRVQPSRTAIARDLNRFVQTDSVFNRRCPRKAVLAALSKAGATQPVSLQEAVVLVSCHCKRAGKLSPQDGRSAANGRAANGQLPGAERTPRLDWTGARIRVSSATVCFCHAGSNSGPFRSPRDLS